MKGELKKMVGKVIPMTEKNGGNHCGGLDGGNDTAYPLEDDRTGAISYEDLTTCGLLEDVDPASEDFVPDSIAAINMRRDFILECGIYLVSARRFADFSQAMLKRTSGIAKSTLSKIESGTMEHGTHLNTLGLLGRQTGFSLAIRFHPLKGTGVPMILPIRQKSASKKFQAIVRQMRESRGMTQSDLERSLCEISTPDAASGLSLSGYVSRIESGDFEKGVRVGRVSDIAFACGYSVELDYNKGV